MKKILASIIVIVFAYSVGASALAAETTNVDKVMELIGKTNQDIDKEIEKAVKNADKLQAEYIKHVREAAEGKEIAKLKEEKEKAVQELNNNKQDAKKEEKAMEKLNNIEKEIAEKQAKVEEKIQSIQTEIDALNNQIAAGDRDETKLAEKVKRLTEKLDEKSGKVEALTNKYTKDLQNIIDKINDLTIKMSSETIKKAAEKGVKAETSWKLVRFADKWVWVDPIRVVGC